MFCFVWTLDKSCLWLYRSQVMTWYPLTPLVCRVTSHHQDLNIKLVKEKKKTWLFSLKFNLILFMWHEKTKMLCSSATSWSFVNYSPSSVVAPAFGDKFVYMEGIYCLASAWYFPELKTVANIKGILWWFSCEFDTSDKKQPCSTHT